MHILYLNYSGTDIPKRKPTVRRQQKVKRLKVGLSGGVFFERNTINKDSQFLPSEKDKDEGGSLSLMNREHLTKKRYKLLMKRVMMKKRKGMTRWGLLMKIAMKNKW